jgi:chemotaxis protein methyltransferase CheR
MEWKSLSDSEYRWFSEFISNEYGLLFGPEKRDILRSRLDPVRLELGFDTFEQLFFHLKYHPDREIERQKLIPRLTNNESYFFRESGQLEVLRNEVLPELSSHDRSAGRPHIDILSAGCAAGEEAYSLAIIVHESVLSASPRVRITGVDLDPEALERARTACYGENAFRRVDPDVRDRYFSAAAPGRWRLDPRIARMVQFQQANLADPTWARALPPQDVIFCRNLLIYFGDDTIRRVVDTFYDLLRPGGSLFLGHAETLSRVPTKFVTVRRPGAIYYRRPED